MGHGAYTYYFKTMAAAATTATIDVARAFDNVYLQIPSMTSSANLDLYVSTDGSSYYQYRQGVAATTTVQCWSFVVAATAAANGSVVPLPPGFRYYRVVADSAPAAATTFKIICGG